MTIIDAHPLIFLVIGLVGLWIGSGITVESSKKLALHLGVSPLLVGLSIISIGTSLPEIMTNLFAGLDVAKGIEASGIAVGTNIGSDLTQITFILGLTAVIGIISFKRENIIRDGLMVLGSIILVFLFGLTGGRVSFIEGLILLIIYLFYLFKISRKEHAFHKLRLHMNHDSQTKEYFVFKQVAFIAAGIAILIFSTKLVVDNALILSDVWGVAQSFIGVMIIGVGTGLPELSTSIRAVIKKSPEISVGTLIGSNITDPMMSLPIGAIASGAAGLSFEKNLLFFDIPFWFGASIIALLLITNKKMQINKKEGAVLIGIYALFVFLKIKYFMF